MLFSLQLVHDSKYFCQLLALVFSISNSLFLTTSFLKFILGGFGKGDRGGELPKHPFL